MKLFLTLTSDSSASVNEKGSDGIVWLSLPDSTMMKTGKRFFIPDFDNEFFINPVVIMKLDRLGKSVAEKFARRYVSEITGGFITVAADEMDCVRKEALPWGRAVVFDNSAWIGDFLKCAENTSFGDPVTMDFSINSDEGDSHLIFEDPLHSESVGLQPARCVSVISDRNTVKIGDMVMMKLPCEGIRLRAGMNIRILIDGEEVFRTTVK